MAGRHWRGNHQVATYRWFSAAIMVLALPILAFADKWEWSAKAGLNYDLISHNYYLQIVDTLALTPDSLLELKSTSDRIDEKGCFLRLDLQSPGALKAKISNRTYVTSEKFRTLVDLTVHWRTLKFTTNMEFKSYTSQQEFSLYKSQFRNSSRLGIKLLTQEHRQLEISQEFEYIGYHDRDPRVVGYYQSESRLRFRQRLAEFADLDIALQLDLRESYDSAQLDLTRITADLNYSRISDKGYLATTLYLENRDYALPDAKDDYLYVSPTFVLDRSLSESLALAPRVELHYYRYDAESFTSFSNVRTLIEVQLKYHYQLLSTFSFGLGKEVFAATDDDFSDQDYRSPKLLAGFETLSSTWLMLSIDGQLGLRDYLDDGNEFYSDYRFIRLDLLADIRFTPWLRLSLMGGADFEYHNLKENDILVHLISATLTYQVN